MSQVKVAAIVEGHGEYEAVPVLIRRIAQSIDPGFSPDILRPLRIPASRLIKHGELERAVEFAARKLQGSGGIVIILDGDWEDCCPAREGPQLLRRAQDARQDVPVRVIIAKKEFEAWFIAAAESMRGKRRLPMNLNCPPDPENIRGAKEWLTGQMSDGSYSETADQAALTAVFDIDAARRADSFDKCYRDVRSILEQLRSAAEQ